MGKISEYQQQKLQSSLLGTPGLDTTGAELASGIAGSTNELGGALIAGANQSQAITNRNAANAFPSVRQEYLARKAQQRVLEAEQKQQLDSWNASNHNKNFGIELDNLYSTLAQDKTILPAALPSEWLKQSDEHRKAYIKANPMNDAVIGAFQKDSNAQIEQTHRQANRDARTFATDEAEALHKVTEQNQVNAVTSDDAFQKFQQVMATPASQKDYFRAYGAKDKLEAQRVVRAAAENALWSTAMAAPNVIPGLIGSGRYNVLEQDKLKAISQFAQSKIDGIHADIERKNKIDDGADILKASSIVDAIVADPNAPDYAQQLANGRQQITSLLNDERNKPIRTSDSPTTDSDLKPIQYQRPAVIKALEERRNYFDTQLRSEAAFMRGEAKEQAAQVKETAKQQTEHIESIAKDEHTRFVVDGAQPRAALQSALGDLRAFRLPGLGTPAAKKHRAGDNEAEAFNAAVTRFRQAEVGGYLDEPGKGNKASSMILKELNMVGARLKGERPSAFGLGLTEMALAKLNRPAPRQLTNIISGWHGRTADDTNREFTYRMLQTYEQFKDVMQRAGKSIEPSSDTVEHWRNKIHANMKLEAANTPIHHIPPPPSARELLQAGTPHVMPATGKAVTPGFAAPPKP